MCFMPLHPYGHVPRFRIDQRHHVAFISAVFVPMARKRGCNNDQITELQFLGLSQVDIASIADIFGNATEPIQKVSRTTIQRKDE